ncbi:tetratricopeptide repeat protein [Methylomonas sp. MgM2]
MLIKEHKTNEPLLTQGFFLIAITLAYCWISRPGLAGGFILDDWPNLAGLDQVKIHGQLSLFSLSGAASELGRPISLLSFALQAQDWPDNPYPFKLAGLIIQVVNAWLVYACCYLIGRIRNWPQRHVFIFAGSVLIFWLFLPLNISTVFYVVQRMTLLAGLFSLIGIAAFLWGVKQRSNTGLAYATLGLLITYVCGILSKENAILSGLYLSVVYALLIPEQYKSKLWNWWIIIFGILPSLTVIAYLCIGLGQHTRPEFGPYERLLTETVILQDYLNHILLPTPGKLNIFNDGYPVYKNLFESFIGIQAVCFWSALFALAFFLRRRAVFFAFGVFWFLAGHLLESTVFGLELYFEHRNYLPSLGIIMGIIGTTVELNARTNTLSDTRQTLLKYGSTALLAMAAGGHILVYGAEISTWSSPGALAISALTERPHSLRAHQEAAAYFANIEDYATSTLLLQSIEQKWPGYPGTYSQLVMLSCLDSNVILPQAKAIKQRLQAGRFDRGTLDAWHQIYEFKKNGNCPNLSWDQYQEYIELLINNKDYGSQKDDFIVLLALSLNASGRYSEAAKALDQFPENIASLDFLILKARFYAMAGDKEESLQIIERARIKYANDLRVWLPRESRINTIKKQLELSKAP